MPQPSTPIGISAGSTSAAAETSSSMACWHGCSSSRYPSSGQPRARQRASIPACFPEQLCSIRVGPASAPRVPHSRSSSPAGAFASRLRTASSCSGRARWDAHAIAISVSSRSVRARKSGRAWTGFTELRKYVTSSGVTSRRYDLAAGHRDRVRSMTCLDDIAPDGFDDDRLHGAERSGAQSLTAVLANGRQMPYVPRSSTEP